jgi:hypothetical protein
MVDRNPTYTVIANFATPADGTSGQMRMYIWTQSTPQRDGDLANDVIAHEQTHGTTNRMTGVRPFNFCRLITITNKPLGWDGTLPPDYRGWWYG